MNGVWREDVQVGWRDADCGGRLSLQGAVAYFQEAAISHAEALGAGKDALASAQDGVRRGWVLSRMTVFVAKRPRWKDTVTVSTWPRGDAGLFAVRDYRISLGEEDLVLGRALWLVIDLDRRRPLRPRTVTDHLPRNEGLDVFSGSPLSGSPLSGSTATGSTVTGSTPALQTREDFRKTAGRQAYYPDIDFNGHMNHVRYISWIEETAPEGMMARAEKIRLDINYLAEVKPGDRVGIFTAPADLAGPPSPPALSAVPPWQNAIAWEGRSGSVPVFRAELRVSGEEQQPLFPDGQEN
jgi:acyl-ACP thioesterase